MTATPVRVQCTRRLGLPGVPPGAVYVGRGRGAYGRWGNPVSVVRIGVGPWRLVLPDGRPSGAYTSKADADRAAVEAFRVWVREPEQSALRAAARRELAGRDLACWCKPGDPCHGDTWLVVANTPEEPDHG